jgi:hypothetical protein
VERVYVAVFEQRRRLGCCPDCSARLSSEPLKRWQWHVRLPPPLHQRGPDEFGGRLLLAERLAARRIALVDDRLDVVESQLMQDQSCPIVDRQGEEDVLVGGPALTSLKRDLDGPLEDVIAGSASRQPPEDQLVSDSPAPKDRGVHGTRADSVIAQKLPHSSPACKRQQEVLWFDRRGSQHARLILGKRDQVGRFS